LANLSFELSEFHELRFNFLYVQSAEDDARRIQGADETTEGDPNSLVDQAILDWTERNLTYFQFGGGHEAPGLNNIRLDWGAAFSTTTQEQPDFRIFRGLGVDLNSSNPSWIPQSNEAPPDFPTRFWRDLEEENTNLRADLTVPLPSYNSKETALKTGVALSTSERTYEQRAFEVWNVSNNHPYRDEGDPNILVTPENLDRIQYRNFLGTVSYDGEQEVSGVYLMADWAALEWLQLIGGARYETTDISIQTTDFQNPANSTSGLIDQSDLLPAVSAIVQISPTVDLRVAYSKTVIRPTYREIADVQIYDVTRLLAIRGNPDLEVSESENYDFRASWYPRPGEVLSASLFAKKIDRPIELAQINPQTITYQNYEKADVFGVEGEIRIGLDRIWDELKPFTLGFNGAYITSEVPRDDTQKSRLASVIGAENVTDTRPLFNQPTYILNADLTWDIAKTRTTITLSGGVVGENLVLIGFDNPDEFAQPAPELNFFIRQRIGKHWDVRFTAKNLLNPDIQIAQNDWPSRDNVVVETYTKGITLGLSIGCEF
jgi:outer membrane receptor protein involved in Fe transport